MQSWELPFRGNMRPIIRWAGSKRQLLPCLLPYIPTRYNRYIEPFAGSACLFFELAPKKAILGDINPHLMSAYRQLRRHPTRLHEAVSSIPRTPKRYYVERSKNISYLDAFEKAVRFFYLNRNCFNAVYRVNQRGEFNVPWGSNTGALPAVAEFRESAAALRHADLVTADFEKVLDLAKRGDFIYIDPPYSKSVADEPGLFGAGAFNREHLSRLVRALHKLDRTGAVFLMSFEFDKELIKGLSQWRVEKIQARRHVAGFAHARGVAQEILLTNSRF
ncbi:MAG: Methyl-directed repair DNA adenine methylase [Rhodanobacteraceae bacterium]|jgi:DNA adenine methylase|nr:MAG: Methyl-directed repair DNA adenine methylase [Rhodanobacteraceae bacterium]